MFPEFESLAEELKANNPHFLSILNKHRDLDQKIVKMEFRELPAASEQMEVEALKKKRLALKDELYQILRKASGG
jgi:uncharacterized protein